jgi:hypothetical protein
MSHLCSQLWALSWCVSFVFFFLIFSLSFQPPNGYPIQDDVLGVVNHLGQMVTFLLLELRTTGNCSNNENHMACPCLDFLLSENLLEKLFSWSVHTGRYEPTEYVSFSM